MAAKAAEAAAAAAAAVGNGVTTEEEFDIASTRFKGQFALRKLYHESDRLMAVLYTCEERGREGGCSGGSGRGID